MSTTPLTAVDTELDNLLERVAVKSANQYGGFEGWDDEADKQDVIGESRKAIKALIGTTAEQIIGEDDEYKAGDPIGNMGNAIENELRAEQRQRKAQLLSTPAPQDGSVNPEAPERLKDYMENNNEYPKT